jgi:DNA modification methylase
MEDGIMGSRQTAIAALQYGLQFVGYETMPEYVELANKRIKTGYGFKTFERADCQKEDTNNDLQRD